MTWPSHLDFYFMLFVMSHYLLRLKNKMRNIVTIFIKTELIIKDYQTFSNCMYDAPNVSRDM